MRTYTRQIIDKEILEKLIKERKTLREICKETGFTMGVVIKNLTEYDLRLNSIKKHTDKTKEKMSLKRKEWLAKNPEKHPWRSKDKFRSIPCNTLKYFLKSKNIEFIEEYQPGLLDGRFHSIDIAFPEKKIAIEVNGNQHYEKDGTLKPYYKERHEYLEKLGWTVIEIHYSLVYNTEFVENLASKITKSEKIADYNHTEYIMQKMTRKEKKYLCTCGNEMSIGAKKCMSCRAKESQKFAISKEELENLLKQFSMEKIGRMFNVSGNAIKLRCKKYNIVR
jgi:hypothetical protein